jgi:putative hydrolase of the HAD superfamily
VALVRAVFFDAGETLVYPHPSFPELFAQVVREQGLDLDPAVVRDNMFVIADRFREAAREGELWSTSPERSRRFWSDVYRLFLDRLGLPFEDGLAHKLYTTFSDVGNYRLFPDVPPILARLQGAGLTLGVVSNFEEWLARLLESLGVDRFFQVRVISGVEGVEKPDRQIFELALDRAGVSARESVYVGDSPTFDVEPAREVGMLAVLIDRRGRFPEHDGIRLSSLEELPAVLGLTG